jgi:hypothetical protein
MIQYVETTKMKFTKHIVLMVALMMITMVNTHASDIKVTEATQQKWHSGMSYKNGILYNIGLTIYPSKHPVILDTLWLEGNCRSLASYNYKGRSKSDTLSVYISDGLNYDGKIQVDASWCKDPGKKGIMISYHQNNTRYLLDITPYIKELMFIAYP